MGLPLSAQVLQIVKKEIDLLSEKNKVVQLQADEELTPSLSLHVNNGCKQKKTLVLVQKGDYSLWLLGLYSTLYNSFPYCTERSRQIKLIIFKCSIYML